MPFARTVAHSTTADGTFSVDGVNAWDGVSAHTPAVSGATSGGIPYFDDTDSEKSSGLLGANQVIVGGGAGAAPSTSANLTYTETSGPRLRIGTGGTSAGLVMGYAGASGWAGIAPDGITLDASNQYVLLCTSTSTYLGSPNAGGSVNIGAYGGNNIVCTAVTNYAARFVGATKHDGIAFASLPSAIQGMVAHITDSNTATWGATIAGGGSNIVLGFFNGTNWTVAGV